MFEHHCLDSIQQVRLNDIGRDQNKLRLYKTFKGSFSEEPMFLRQLQRCALTGLCVSAHHHQIELGRYSVPTTPIQKRYCKNCYREPISKDTEFHFLFECGTFELKRQCFLGKLSALGVTINNAWPDNLKIANFLCPTSTQASQCVNKYISILEKSRKMID